MNISLRKRFAASDLHQCAGVRQNLIKQRIDRSGRSFSKGIFRIAVSTTQWATGQAYENTWLSHPCRFALNRKENFVDAKCHDLLNRLVDVCIGLGKLHEAIGRKQKSCRHSSVTATKFQPDYPKSMPRRGLEPPRDFSHQHLKLARLPIPPPGLIKEGGAEYTVSPSKMRARWSSQNRR